MTEQDLLKEIEAFLATPNIGMSATTFGRLAVNDGKFVARIRSGKGLTLATADKVRNFIQAHRARPSVGVSA